MLNNDHARILHEMAQHRQRLQNEADTWRLLNAHRPYQPQFHRQMLRALGGSLVRVGQRLEGIASSGKRYPAYTPEWGQ